MSATTPPSHMAGMPTAKYCRNSVVSEAVGETLANKVIIPSMVAMKVVITEAANHAGGRTRVSLQFKQAYFSGPKILDGSVCHT